jgi:hypothetical protein
MISVWKNPLPLIKEGFFDIITPPHHHHDGMTGESIVERPVL